MAENPKQDEPKVQPDHRLFVLRVQGASSCTEDAIKHLLDRAVAGAQESVLGSGVVVSVAAEVIERECLSLSYKEHHCYIEAAS